MMMLGLAHILDPMTGRKPQSTVDRELLLTSAKHGYLALKEIKSLLAMGASTSSRNGSGSTALMISALNNNKPAFDLLLPASNPALRDCGGLQAVDIAALTGRDYFVEALLADGRSEFSHQAMSGGRHWTPLMHAVAGGHHRCMELLLPASELLDTTILGSTALSATLSSQRAEPSANIAKALLLAEPRLGLILGESQEPILFHAIRSKALLVAEALIPYSDLNLRIGSKNALDLAQERAPSIANLIRAAIESKEIDCSTRAPRHRSSPRTL